MKNYEIVSSGYFKIKSIRRTSDGKIFSLGDHVFIGKELCEIILIHKHNYPKYKKLFIICVSKKTYVKKRYFNVKISEIDKVLTVS